MSKDLRNILIFVVIVLILIVHYQGVRFVKFQKDMNKDLAAMKKVMKEIEFGKQGFKDEREMVNAAAKREALLEKYKKEYRSLMAVNADLIKVQAQVRYLKDSFMRSSQFNKLQVYRSSDDPALNDDVNINRSKEGMINNYGGGEVFVVGRYEDNLSRTLIRFNDLSTAIPAGAKIIYAALHIKGKSEMHDNADGYSETLNLYRVLKNWGEGKQEGVPAQNGDVTWDAAKYGETKWNTPGLWPDKKDVNTLILASAEGVRKSREDLWVDFYFNTNGIEVLTEMIKSSYPNYGFLIKLANEDGERSSFNFISSENTTAQPYMEIIYQAP